MVRSRTAATCRYLAHSGVPFTGFAPGETCRRLRPATYGAIPSRSHREERNRGHSLFRLDRGASRMRPEMDWVTLSFTLRPDRTGEFAAGHAPVDIRKSHRIIQPALRRALIPSPVRGEGPRGSDWTGLARFQRRGALPVPLSQSCGGCAAGRRGPPTHAAVGQRCRTATPAAPRAHSVRSQGGTTALSCAAPPLIPAPLGQAWGRLSRRRMPSTEITVSRDSPGKRLR